MAKYNTTRDEFREHAADTIGKALGPDVTLRQWYKQTGMPEAGMRRMMSGESNLQIDSLSRVAYLSGYRVRLVLEPIEEG